MNTQTRPATKATLYAVYHRTCGHIINAANSRPLALEMLARLFDETTIRQFRIRVATDDDLAALLRGDRCATCSFDGEVTA